MPLVDRKDFGDAVQETPFPLVQDAVRLGDVEKPVEYVDEHRAVLAAGAA